MRSAATYGLLLLIALASGLNLNAQNADALIDRDEILIGEQVVLSLSCRLSKENPEDIVFPVLTDTIVNKVEIVSQSSIDTLQTSDGASETRLEQKFHITSFDTGYYVIPPFQFKINGEIEQTDPLLLGVKTVEIDTTASIKQAKPNYSVDVGFADYVKVYWPYGAGAIGLAILATVILIILKKQKARPPKPVSKPEIIDTRPPHEIALAELNRITEESIYKEGLVKQYHTEITETLRDFIEGQFNIHTHEQTSKQILDGLKYSGISEKSTTRLRTILLRADMVKFAKLLPEEQENKQAVEQAVEFVQENQPREISEDE